MLIPRIPLPKESQKEYGLRNLAKAVMRSHNKTLFSKVSKILAMVDMSYVIAKICKISVIYSYS